MKIDSYIWKDARVKDMQNPIQVETRLVDMTDDQLQMCYSHCKEMLYNTDPKNLGRMIVLQQISKQLDCIGAELALRYFKSLTDTQGNYIYTSEGLLCDVLSWVRSIPNYKPADNYRLKDILQVPAEYQGVLIEDLIKACKDTLGAFNHSKITRTFIYDRLGLYLTSEELKEIDNDLREHGLNPNKIALQTKIDNHIKFPLGIQDVTVKINPKGLSGKEFKDMINLKKLKGYKYCKYSALSDSQLHTLRSKVLHALEARVANQACMWSNLMNQIEEVAKYKHYTLE